MIRHILKSFKWPEVIDILRGDDTDLSREVINFYDSLADNDKPYFRYEEICAALNIPTRKLLEVITGATMEQSAMTAKIIAAAAQPKIVGVTVREAQKAAGDRDREMYHRATGFLPTPKGSTTNINLQQLNQGAQSTQGALLAPPEDNTPAVLGSMDEFLLDIQDVVKPKQLNAPTNSEAPSASDLPANADVIESEYIIAADV